jgi:hypothetical protein
MSEHTPEPWYVECQSGGYVEVQDRDGKSVFATLFVEQDLANLQRVVLCVNALAGVANKGLESLATIEGKRPAPKGPRAP